jgi:hypothetical protein
MQMRVRTSIAIVAAVLALGAQPLFAAAGSRSDTDQTANIARSVAAGRRSTLPAGSGFERLGGLTDDELKAWAAQHLVAPSHTPYLHSLVECTSAASESHPDSQLDCDTKLPNNEPDIEVDPLDPQHMVASSNDYDSCCDAFYATFDGGQTWTQGNMSAEDTGRTGSDPVTVFEPVSGNVIHSSLNYGFTQKGFAKDGDVVVSISHDGGVTWRRPVVVADGQGTDIAPTQIFNDKEWIAVDTDPGSPYYGRTYLTWTAFLSHYAHTAESPIFEAHSDDGGRTWSAPQEISGSAPFCSFVNNGRENACNSDQFSVPATAPDGTVYVSFINDQNESIWEPGEQLDDQYLVVKSTDGGATWSDPVMAAALEDGAHDFPKNADGRQTLTGLQFRLSSTGNIAVDPISGNLYLTFADNRNGIHDVHHPVSNSDVFVVTSTDGGDTWSAPDQVDPSTSDQWFPYVDVDPTTGEVGITYSSRNEADPDLYNQMVAIGAPGAFTLTQMSTAPSDPAHAVFFKAHAKHCFACSRFIGDYNRIAFGSDGAAHVVWTDMRRVYRGDDLGRHLQFIFYRQIP